MAACGHFFVHESIGEHNSFLGTNMNVSLCKICKCTYEEAMIDLNVDYVNNKIFDEPLTNLLPHLHVWNENKLCVAKLNYDRNLKSNGCKLKKGEKETIKLDQDCKAKGPEDDWFNDKYGKRKDDNNNERARILRALKIMRMHNL